jgi:hypothetical protein
MRLPLEIWKKLPCELWVKIHYYTLYNYIFITDRSYNRIVGVSECPLNIFFDLWVLSKDNYVSLYYKDTEIDKMYKFELFFSEISCIDN